MVTQKQLAGAIRVLSMDAVQQEVTDIFIRTKALLQGHFVLRSGLHSGHFFQCAQVCQDMPAVERLGALLKQKLGTLAYDTVLAPAMGGLVIGQEVARQAGAFRSAADIAQWEPILNWTMNKAACASRPRPDAALER